MSARPDPRFDRLLSGRDRPSITEREAVLDRLLEGAGPRTRPFWTVERWAWALAAAAAALLLVPSALLLHGRGERLTARGGAEPVAVVELACSRGDPAQGCPRGAKLFFRVQAPEKRRYFAALGVSQTGSAVWYFPSGDAQRSELLPAAGSGVLAQAIVLGDEHLPGVYQVLSVFSEWPMAREEIRKAIEDAAERSTTIVRGRRVVEGP